MSDLMWWSVVVRASMRWVMVGSWCGWLVLVGGGFFIWGSRVCGGVVWVRVRWGLMIGGGEDVVICSIRVRVLGCGVCLRRCGLGVRLQGGLLLRVRFVDVVVIGETGCDLISLLEACVSLRLYVFCCVSSGKLSPVASMSSVLLLERLRLVLCVVCGWWIVHVVV